MLRYGSALSLAELRTRINRITYGKDSTGIEMAFGQGSGVAAEFQDVAQEIAALRALQPINLMINSLPPGVVVPEHVDLKPVPGEPHQWRERWHLPVVTNPEATYRLVNASGVTVEGIMDAGYWYGPFPYWRKHGVANLGKQPRVHIIVDLATDQALGEFE